MSSDCCGRLGVVVFGSTTGGPGGAGLDGAMTGVLTGGDTDELVAGTGEDGAEAAPTQTSTATRPRLRRRPHDDCQSPPGTLVSAEDGSPSASSTRSSVTGVSPQADSQFWLFPVWRDPAWLWPRGCEMGRRVHFRPPEGLVRSYDRPMTTDDRSDGGSVLHPEARALLESDALAHLVTLNADGSPQVTCIWVGLDGEEIVSGHLP